MFKTILWRKPTPQVTPQVTPQATPQAIMVKLTQSADLQLLENRLISIMSGEMTRQTMMQLQKLKDIKKIHENYLNPAINNVWIEMTNLNAQGSNQSYRLTRKGKIKQTKMNK